MVEPVPETQEVLRELARWGGEELGQTLRGMGERARAIAPDCVGLSLGLFEDGLTLTLIASGEEIASLDAVQYLDDGPCIASQKHHEVVGVDLEDLLDEGRWAAYARAGAATGVASSLSLPIEREGQVIGGVNLYGATPDAFETRHERLAAALGTSARDAITNADLTFSTRLAAAQAPGQFARSADIEVALGVIAEARGVDVARARDLLEQAAARAGLPPARAARVLRHLYDD